MEAEALSWAYKGSITMGEMPLSEKPDKKRFSVTLAQPVLDDLDCLIEAGLYLDQQDVIRDFIRHGLQTYGLGGLTPTAMPEETC